MRNFGIFILVGFLFMISGCNNPPATPPGVRMDITVHNGTNQHIYVVVHSGNRHEDFGVVGAQKGATIGFGLGKVGATVQLEWSIGHPDAPKKTVTLSLPAPVNDEVTFTYQPDGTWTTVPPKP